MEFIVEMINIEKTFQNNIRALNKANLRVAKGEIHSIVGENAAGKTTLMNILYGMLQPDKGEIFIKGEKRVIMHPRDAIKYGIGMVHQHFKLVPEFSVLENIILGRESSFTTYGWKIDYTKAEEAVKEMLEKINIDINLHERAEKLSIGIQQKVEIVKTLFRGAEIIILDEPTTVLAPNEIDDFLSFLKKLNNQGSTIIYISHRLKEVFHISDRITVLRRGETIKTLKTTETSMEEISSLMIGGEFKKNGSNKSRLTVTGDNAVLEVENLSAGNFSGLDKVSFSIKEGEILGIAGVEGNGQVELADTIIGLQKRTGGNIYFFGKLINEYSILKRREEGIHYVPDDRIKKGVSLDSSIIDNTIMGYQRTPFIKKSKYLMDWKKAMGFTQKVVNEFRVEGTDSFQDQVRNLSGGNIQKLILGREMMTNPSLLILAQPTAGLDFNAQNYIHDKIRQFKEMGTAFLLISEDVDELMDLSDRILVLYRGRIVKEFLAGEGYNEKEIGYYMTGVKGIED